MYNTVLHYVLVIFCLIRQRKLKYIFNFSNFELNQQMSYIYRVRVKFSRWFNNHINITKTTKPIIMKLCTHILRTIRQDRIRFIKKIFKKRNII